jgi:hypothetical protein
MNILAVVIVLCVGSSEIKKTGAFDVNNNRYVLDVH